MNKIELVSYVINIDYALSYVFNHGFVLEKHSSKINALITNFTSLQVINNKIKCLNSNLVSRNYR